MRFSNVFGQLESRFKTKVEVALTAVAVFAVPTFRRWFRSKFGSRLRRMSLNGEEENRSFMSTKLYVGNLSFDTTEQDLEKLFSAYGTVSSANIIEDRETGRPRGFGFVEMSSAEEVQKAIAELNGKEVSGRELKVNEAKPQQARSGGGGGGRNYGGGYGGGSGGGSYGNSSDSGGFKGEGYAGVKVY